MRTNMVIMGRCIGTAGGWDQAGDWCVAFYDPQFNELGRAIYQRYANIEAIDIDAETGVSCIYNDGEQIDKINFLDKLIEYRGVK